MAPREESKRPFRVHSIPDGHSGPTLGTAHTHTHAMEGNTESEFWAAHPRSLGEDLLTHGRVRLMIPRILRHITVSYVHCRFGRSHVPRGDRWTHGGRADSCARAEHSVGWAVHGVVWLRRRLRHRVCRRRREARRWCRFAAGRRRNGALGILLLELGFSHLLVLRSSILEPNFNLQYKSIISKYSN